MRKFHRWLSVLFGAVLLWIAVTGVMIQFADLVAKGERGAVARQAAAVGRAIVPPAAAHGDEAAEAKEAFVCPPDMTCRPRPAKDSARAWVNYLQHLHSGEEFGPAGTVISILGGFALLFFAFSGLWMYISMWRERSRRSLKPGWFWK